MNVFSIFLKTNYKNNSNIVLPKNEFFKQSVQLDITSPVWMGKLLGSNSAYYCEDIFLIMSFNQCYFITIDILIDFVFIFSVLTSFLVKVFAILVVFNMPI